MFFVSSKVFWLLIAPSSLLLFCFVFAVLMSALQFKRVAQAFYLLATTAFLLIGTTPAIDYAFYYWGKGNQPPKNINLQDYEGVIVLGGAIDLHETAAQNRLILNGNYARITELLALRAKAPYLKVIYSGGSGYLINKTDLREADIFKDYFVNEFKSDSSVIYTENQSKNTYENALYSRNLYISKFSKEWPNVEPWLLLTSAYHMPRAYAVFRAQGWNITPYPTPHMTKPVFWNSFTTKFWDNWMKTDVLAREIIGSIAYKLTDKI